MPRPTGYTPSWADVLERAFESHLAQVWVALPGRIEAFDNATGLARIALLLRELIDNTAGTQDEKELPVLNDVPVLVLGGVNFRVKVPVEAGTLCQVHFNDQPLEEWVAGDGGVVTPLRGGRHTLGGATAVIGLRPAAGAWRGPNDRITIGWDGGSCQLAVGQTLIELGYPGASDFVALASKVDSNFNTQQAWNETHTHPETGTVTGTAIPPPPPYPLPVGSASVKVKP